MLNFFTKIQVHHQTELTLAVELSNLLLLLSTSCFSLSSSDAISLSLLHNSLQTEGIQLERRHQSSCQVALVQSATEEEFAPTSPLYSRKVKHSPPLPVCESEGAPLKDAATRGKNRSGELLVKSIHKGSQVDPWSGPRRSFTRNGIAPGSRPIAIVSVSGLLNGKFFEPPWSGPIEVHDSGRLTLD